MVLKVANTHNSLLVGDTFDPEKVVVTYGHQRFTFWGLLEQRWVGLHEVGSKEGNCERKMIRGAKYAIRNTQ